jgi:hypothetical protein
MPRISGSFGDGPIVVQVRLIFGRDVTQMLFLYILLGIARVKISRVHDFGIEWVILESKNGLQGFASIVQFV